MREIRDVRITLAELQGRLGIDRPAGYFAFVFARLGLRDVKVDGDAIVCASFVPLETLLRESIAGLDSEGVKPVPCARCAKWFDPDRADGIFRNPTKLDGFVCRPCAEGLSAWEYFQTWFVG